MVGAVLVIAAAVVGVRAAVHGGSSGSAATTVPASVAKLRRQIDQRLSVSGTPVARTQAVEALTTGMNRLLQSPAVDVSYITEGTEAGRVSATGVVVPPTRSLELKRTTSLDSGGVVSDERRVVGDTLYLRVIDRAGPGVSAPWDSTPVNSEPKSDFDRALTAAGDADGSAPELLELVRRGPFEATLLPGAAARYRLRIPARQLAAHYASNGNSQPLPPDVYPVSVIEFTVGADGVLADLSAYGTVFDDGEPIGPAVVDIHYRPGARQSIEAPPASEMRGH